MPINPLAPTLKVVRCNAKYMDPSLNLDVMDLDKYRTSRDPDLVKSKDGTKPTWFVLKRAKASMVVDLLDGLEGHTKLSWALRACLVRVEVAGDDEPIVPASVSPSAYGGEMAGADWLQTIVDKFGKETALEIGRVAYELSGLGEGARGPLFSSGT